MAVVYSKVLLFDPPLIYTAPDTCVFGAVISATYVQNPPRNVESGRGFAVYGGEYKKV